MKNIKDYVCTIEQAKKLKDLGVEQNSLWYFCELDLFPNCIYGIVSCNDTINGQSPLDGYSAFTSQELGSLIRDITEYAQYNEEFISRDNEYGRIITLGIIDENLSMSFPFMNEVQARAKFLIHLLENKNDENN